MARRFYAQTGQPAGARAGLERTVAAPMERRSGWHPSVTDVPCHPNDLELRTVAPQLRTRHDAVYDTLLCMQLPPFSRQPHHCRYSYRGEKRFDQAGRPAGGCVPVHGMQYLDY